MGFSLIMPSLVLDFAISFFSCPCSLRLVLPYMSVPLFCCYIRVLLCDVHFNHFIMHLVGRRVALDGLKFIKGAVITICPLKMALLILFMGGNNSLKEQSVFEICCCLSLAQTALALGWSKMVWICVRFLLHRFDYALFSIFLSVLKRLLYWTLNGDETNGWFY